MKINAIYPGTFDPITFGHIDVIKKALKIVDTVIVAISETDNKNYFFDAQERMDIVKKALFSDLKFNKKKIHIIEKNKKKLLKGLPYPFLKILIENFNFPLPKSLPPLSSLLVGYFSYDIIRYIEKIPDSCSNDLKIPDIRLMRPKTIIILDNLLKKIYFIINCFADQKINNYSKYYLNQIKNIQNLKNLAFHNKIQRKIQTQTNKKIKVKSNISKKTFKKM